MSENPNPANGDAQVSPAVIKTEPGMDSVTVSIEKTSVANGESVLPDGKCDAIVKGEQQNNNVNNSKGTVNVDTKGLNISADVKIKKEKKPAFEDDDPFAALDWKDGIATLPGI